MPYAELQDLIDRYGEDQVIVAADHDGDGTPDTAVVDQALADADAEIDAYIGDRYQLPMQSVPPILVRLAADIAFHRLSPEADVATEHRKRRYDDAVALLRRIAKGEASLGMPETPKGVAPATAESRPRRWNRGRRLT